MICLAHKVDMADIKEADGRQWIALSEDMVLVRPAPFEGEDVGDAPWAVEPDGDAVWVAALPGKARAAAPMMGKKCPGLFPRIDIPGVFPDNQYSRDFPRMFPSL